MSLYQACSFWKGQPKWLPFLLPGMTSYLLGFSPQDRDARLKIVEEFSDFRIEKGLNLPHTYKLELSFQSETNPLLADWLLNLTDFTFNQTLDAKQFRIGN